MTHQNSIFGRLRSLFSTDPTEPVVEDDEPDHRPIVGTENVENGYKYVAEYTIERTVELIHFAQGGTLVVEYDQIEERDQKLVFKSVTDIVSAGSGYTPGPCTQLEYDNTVSTVNDMAVAHREELGTIEVTLARPTTLKETYERVVNMDELPSEVTYNGIPDAHAVARDEDDTDFDRGWGGHGFETYDGQVVWNRSYSFETFRAPTRIETDRSMGEVLQDAVQGGASAMRAVSADGSVLMPDQEIDGGDDVTQVQALPSANRQP